MRYSIFSVNDHHPRLPRTVPQLYAQLMAQCELGEAEDILANGVCLLGSVETVADKVRGLHDMGIRHLATMHNFGALDPARVERSMTLFARGVMPAVASGTSTRGRTSGSARSSSGAPQ